MSAVDVIKPRPTKTEFLTYLEETGKTPEDFAAYSGYSVEEIKAWIGHGKPIPRYVMVLMNDRSTTLY